MSYTTPVAGNSATTTATVVDTNFKEAGTGLYHYAADTGAANAMVVTLAPAITAYTTGLQIRTVAAATSTATSVTVNVSGLGVKTLRKYVRGAIANVAAGEIIAGMALSMTYDGTYFIMHNPTASVLGVKVGVDSFTPTSISDTKVITHSLGIIPNLIKIRYGSNASTGAGGDSHGEGKYDGTSYATVYRIKDGNPAYSWQTSSAAIIIVDTQTSGTLGWSATLSTITTTQFTIAVSAYATSEAVVFGWEVS